MKQQRRATCRAIPIALTVGGLLVAGCASRPQEQATKVEMMSQRSDGKAAELEIPQGPQGIAGPDGEMIPNVTIDATVHREDVMKAAERMRLLDRDATEAESIAYVYVYGATPVIDQEGKVVGRWVGRFYDLTEYERGLPAQKAIIKAAEG